MNANPSMPPVPPGDDRWADWEAWDELPEEFDGDDSFEEFEEARRLTARLVAVTERDRARRRPPRVPARESIEVDGLEVELRRKAMRTMRLHVAPDGLIWLGLPYKTPRADAVEMIRRHRRWIDRRLAAAAPAPQPPRLWGEPLDDAVGGLALEELYRRELARVAPKLISHWAPLVGRSPAKVSFRWMTSRWGSCNNRSRRITLNLALAALPPPVMELVVVHELVHLLEANHSPRFWAHMRSLLPDLEDRRAALRSFTPVRRPAAAGGPAPIADRAQSSNSSGPPPRTDPPGRAVQDTLY
ncbi:MAG: M48 family metallopeptidase [Bifidobacteriaceae bacterium]|jgi:predicted metal-dependent hydrolase|nr:M48 family metallopeptidase [Bifidobacteriaceae bacterium]